MKVKILRPLLTSARSLISIREPFLSIGHSCIDSNHKTGRFTTFLFLATREIEFPYFDKATLKGLRK